MMSVLDLRLTSVGEEDGWIKRWMEERRMGGKDGLKGGRDEGVGEEDGWRSIDIVLASTSLIPNREILQEVEERMMERRTGREDDDG